jgi:hypothetical protein
MGHGGMRRVKLVGFFGPILCLGLAVALIFSAEKIQVSKGPRPLELLMPPKDLKYFTLGYHDALADSLWIRVIQDFDLCENSTHHNFDPTPGPVVNDGVCRFGWVYHMIDTVTELSPQFHMPYTSGALMLTTVVNDNDGAEKIFEKGLARFPHDWSLQYYAAYFFIDSKPDVRRAAHLLAEAGKNGAPQWVISLAAGLYTNAGQAALAKKVLEETLEASHDARWEPRLRDRLKLVEKQLVEAQNREALEAQAKRDGFKIDGASQKSSSSQK